MLIKSFSSKVCGLRLFFSTDRVCMTRYVRHLSNVSVCTHKWRPQDNHRPSIQRPDFQLYFWFSQQANNGISGFSNGQDFDHICNETLESLTDYFEELVETSSHLKDADVNYSDGVLTVQFGSPHGTYVINRQSPNQQIWLSSPRSGPKRYDFDHGNWVYRHDGVSLHQLLDREVGDILRHDVDFSQCSYSGTQE